LCQETHLHGKEVFLKTHLHGSGCLYKCTCGAKKHTCKVKYVLKNAPVVSKKHTCMVKRGCKKRTCGAKKHTCLIKEDFTCDSKKHPPLVPRNTPA
jgi:hypothetical protein